METIAVIDGHYYAYRCYFGAPKLANTHGRPTGVTYSFAKMFKSLRENDEITHIALVFDSKEKSFRHEMYEEYKAHRDPMPDDLRAQIPDIIKMAEESGIKVCSIGGYEGDDVIATLAMNARDEGKRAFIASKDKDLEQVLDDKIFMWDIFKDDKIGVKEVKEKRGIKPEQVIDYLCMMGDSADNVPGIKGVGPKTAAKLLDKYDTLQNIFDNVEELKGKQKENIIDFIPKIELTRKLITLAVVENLPAIETFEKVNTLPDEAHDFYHELGFRLDTFFPIPEHDASENSSYEILTKDSLPAFIAKLREIGRFAVDTETTGLDTRKAELVGVSFAYGDSKEAYYLPIQALDQEKCISLEFAIEQLKPLLEDEAVKKIAQNAKYDYKIFLNHGIQMCGLDGDTMLASWVLNPAREGGHSLDFLTEEFLYEKKIKTEEVIDLKNGQTMKEVAVDIVAKYACEDAQCTMRLANVLEKQLEEDGLLSVYRNQEVPLVYCLGDMEHQGVMVSEKVLLDKQIHLEKYLDQVLAEIREIGGNDFNPASPKQVGELLFTKMQLPIIKKTKTGPSTDVSVLNALKHKAPIANLLLQFRSLSKLLSSYLRTLPTYINELTDSIHSSFRQTGTETGRLSSEKPNLQNMPKKESVGREIRAAFVAPDGYSFLAADYSQIELRVLAHLSEDEEMLQAFEDGLDIHKMVAAKIHDCPEELVTPEMRQIAKAVNFGIIYGQSAFGLSSQIGVTRKEASNFIKDYFTQFSSIKDYIDRVVLDATNSGYAETISGRRRFVPLLKSTNKNEILQGERTALNSTIQGSASDIIKKAMLQTKKALPENSYMILQIHDELIICAKDDCLEEAEKALQESMENAWDLKTPLIAEVRQGKDWLSVS